MILQSRRSFMSKTASFDCDGADLFARYFGAHWMAQVPAIPGLFGDGADHAAVTDEA